MIPSPCYAVLQKTSRAWNILLSESGVFGLFGSALARIGALVVRLHSGFSASCSSCWVLGRARTSPAARPAGLDACSGGHGSTGWVLGSTGWARPAGGWAQGARPAKTGGGWAFPASRPSDHAHRLCLPEPWPCFSQIILGKFESVNYYVKGST